MEKHFSRKCSENKRSGNLNYNVKRRKKQDWNWRQNKKDCVLRQRKLRRNNKDYWRKQRPSVNYKRLKLKQLEFVKKKRQRDKDRKLRLKLRDRDKRLKLRDRSKRQKLKLRDRD